MAQPEWHGTREEADDLLEAAKVYCTCVYNAANKRETTCAMHSSMLNDQSFLDRLLYIRRKRDKYIEEEKLPCDE